MRRNFCRVASRISCLARFRATACPTFLLTTKATRVCSRPLARARNMISVWAHVPPCCHTRCTSDSDLSLHARFTPPCYSLGEFFRALDADGQPGASFGTTRFQHLPPALGLHFFAKTMHAQTV